MVAVGAGEDVDDAGNEEADDGTLNRLKEVSALLFENTDMIARAQGEHTSALCHIYYI